MGRPSIALAFGLLGFIDEEDRQGRFLQMSVIKTDFPDDMRYQANYKIDPKCFLIDYGATPKEAIHRVVLQASQHFSVDGDSGKAAKEPDKMEDLF